MKEVVRPAATVPLGCHRNFSPGKNGPRTKIFVGKFGPPGPLFPKKLVHIENFGPGGGITYNRRTGTGAYPASLQNDIGSGWGSAESTERS